MSTPIQLPRPDEIERQIEQKRSELLLLRKLLSASNKASNVLELSRAAGQGDTGKAAVNA